MTTARLPVNDVESLRALAHPARQGLIEALATHGSLTATQASELIGESPSNCSFHLRQLARYGLVEPAVSTDGRTRPWRAVPFGIGVDAEALVDPEYTSTAGVVSDLWTARQAAAERAWARQAGAEPVTWRQAAMATMVFRWLTVEELAALQAAVEAVLEPYRERTDPARRPPGSRPVRLHASAFPVGPATREPGDA